MKKDIVHDFFKKSEKQEGYLYVCRTKNGHPKFKFGESIVKEDGSNDVILNDPQPIFLKYGRTKYLANRMRMYGDGYELIHSVKVNHLKFRESLIHNDAYIEQIKSLTGLRYNDEHIQITDLNEFRRSDLEWPCWQYKNENDIIDLVNHYASGVIALEQRHDGYVVTFTNEDDNQDKNNHSDLLGGGVWHPALLAKFLS
jgi:hypothetical protein